MKTYMIAVLLSWALLAGSCQRTETDQTPQTLEQFLDANSIKATADPRGFYYVIHSPGSGTKPTLNDNVTVNYVGKLTNGSTFDSGTGVNFPLRGLISGWQQGIPLIAPGGRITLYLPPSLAYGSQAQDGIPANSNLIFDIDLIRIN